MLAGWWFYICFDPDKCWPLKSLWRFFRRNQHSHPNSRRNRERGAPQKPRWCQAPGPYWTHLLAARPGLPSGLTRDPITHSYHPFVVSIWNSDVTRYQTLLWVGLAQREGITWYNPKIQISTIEHNDSKPQRTSGQPILDKRIYWDKFIRRFDRNENVWTGRIYLKSIQVT